MKTLWLQLADATVADVNKAKTNSQTIQLTIETDDIYYAGDDVGKGRTIVSINVTPTQYDKARKVFNQRDKPPPHHDFLRLKLNFSKKNTKFDVGVPNDLEKTSTPTKTKKISSNQKKYALSSYLLESAEKDGIPLEVLAIDQLEESIPDIAIINTAPVITGGMHWVAVYQQFYFDPFGLAPDDKVRNLIKKKYPYPFYSDMQEQGIDETNCGYRAYSFINQMHAAQNKVEEFYRIAFS